MNTMITDRAFDVNADLVAKRLYEQDSREWAAEGIALNNECTRELSRFLEEYKSFLGLDDTMFLRLDLYFDNERVYVLDANAAFVDGWGNALNLTRASSLRISDRAMSALSDKFPKKMLLSPWSEPYRPEFELCISEMNMVLWENIEPIREISEEDALRKPDRRKGETRNRIYSYGPYVRSSTNDVFPIDSLRADDKRQLAAFAREWRGKFVIVPLILDSRIPWSRAPQDAVYKIASKSDIEPLGSLGLRRVSIGKPSRPIAKTAWDDGKLVAQERVNPTTDTAGRYRQLIIMAIDDTPVAGYVQNSRNTIVSDNSLQWPLAIGQ